MLKEFRISNFKSINKEQVFSMEACSPRVVTEHPEHVINYKKERLLKVSSFYGPNGGGKSNLLVAFTTMISLILNREIRNDTFGSENYIKCIFSKNKLTVFEAFFIVDNYEIGYSLSVDLTKIKNFSNAPFGANPFQLIDYEICKEEFVYRDLSENSFKTLFIRNENGIVTSDYLKGIDLISNSLPLPKSKTFISYFESSFSFSSTNNEFNPLFSFVNEIKGTVIFARESRTYHFDRNGVDIIEPCLQKVVEILNGVDIRVKEMKFKKILPNAYCLYVYRDVGNGKTSELQYSCESKGTKKLINIIIDVLTNKNCRLFIADDFDAYLHPKLIKVVIDLFTSSSNTNKQLVFNSHDIINMNNKTFRRDEIWFAYRDEEFATNYLPLSNVVDYKGGMVRKDAVYGKQYLEGKYGADPFIVQGLSWK